MFLHFCHNRRLYMKEDSPTWLEGFIMLGISSSNCWYRSCYILLQLFMDSIMRFRLLCMNFRLQGEVSHSLLVRLGTNVFFVFLSRSFFNKSSSPFLKHRLFHWGLQSIFLSNMCRNNEKKKKRTKESERKAIRCWTWSKFLVLPREIINWGFCCVASCMQGGEQYVY